MNLILIVQALHPIDQLELPSACRRASSTCSQTARRLVALNRRNASDSSCSFMRRSSFAIGNMGSCASRAKFISPADFEKTAGCGRADLRGPDSRRQNAGLNGFADGISGGHPWNGAGRCDSRSSQQASPVYSDGLVRIGSIGCKHFCPLRTEGLAVRCVCPVRPHPLSGATVLREPVGENAPASRLDAKSE